MVGGLEQDHAFVAGSANPRQLLAPVGDALEHALHHAVLVAILAVHAHVVARGREPQVHRAEVAAVADAEDAHARMLRQLHDAVA